MPRLDLSTVDRETLPLGAAWLFFVFPVFVLQGLSSISRQFACPGIAAPQKHFHGQRPGDDYS